MSEQRLANLVFLFSDIEQYSSQSEQYPAEMRAARARHYEILVATMNECLGEVVKDAQAGDSFFAVFENPADALLAAREAQRRLRAEPWPVPIRMRVRMGLHWGEAERVGADFAGDAVNRCKRMGDCGHGEQILVSGDLVAEVGDRDVGDVSLRRLGVYQVRDLRDPIEIFQLLAPGLPERFPPLRWVEGTPNNLPGQVSTFVGRQREVAEIRSLVAHHRLVTLRGPGGCGKTRLAYQVAADSLGEFETGVWVVELAGVSEPADVARRTAHVLGLREEANIDIVEHIAHYLRRGKRLLILDNCEHVLDASADLAERLLRACPPLSIIATSRQDFELGGELVYTVPALSLAPAVDAGLEAIAAADAVRLFAERARLADSRFAVSGDNAENVAEICALLDGNALAIELAAARVATMAPAVILGRLRENPNLVVSSRRRKDDRHSSLAAMIAWSYELLTEDEKLVLCQLSVFPGTFDVTAAEAVAGNDVESSADILDLLSGLYHKSLLAIEGRDATVRYHMLRTIRWYAEQRLESQGSTAAIHRRHADYFMRLAEEAEPHLRGPEAISWLDRLEAENGNIQAALSWAVARGDSAVGQRLGGALWRFWYTRSYHREGLEALEAVLALRSDDDVPSRLRRALALHAHGTLAMFLGEYVIAWASLQEALTLRRDVGSDLETAYTLNNLAMVAQATRDMPTARAMFAESGEIKRRLGDDVGQVTSLMNIANIDAVTGRLQQAKEGIARAVAECRRLQLPSLLSTALTMQCNILHIVGEFDAERRALDETMALHEQLGDRQGLAVNWIYLGDWHLSRREFGAAEAAFREAQVLFETLGSRKWLDTVRERRAMLAYVQEDFERAAAELGAWPEAPDSEIDREAWITGARIRIQAWAQTGNLDEAVRLLGRALEVAHAGGDVNSLHEIIESAAVVAVRAGDLVTAVILKSAVDALYAAAGRVGLPAFEAVLEHTLTATYTLGPAALLESWQRGQAMSLDDSVAFVRNWVDAYLQPQSVAP